MGDLEELLRGEVANDVLAAVIRELTRHRTNGGALPGWAQPVCEALAAAADVEPIPLPRSVSGNGPASGNLASTQWVTAGEAADLTGCSERHVRRLAASGQVIARRVGAHSWLIDQDSITGVLRRTA